MGAVSSAVLDAGGQVTGVVPYAMVAVGGEGDKVASREPLFIPENINVSVIAYVQRHGEPPDTSTSLWWWPRCTSERWRWPDAQKASSVFQADLEHLTKYVWLKFSFGIHLKYSH
jgi:hypothetical protein